MPTITRPSVPSFSSTISSAMRRSVRSIARASSTVVCAFAMGGEYAGGGGEREAAPSAPPRPSAVETSERDRRGEGPVQGLEQVGVQSVRRDEREGGAQQR